MFQIITYWAGKVASGQECSCSKKLPRSSSPVIRAGRGCAETVKNLTLVETICLSILDSSLLESWKSNKGL